MPQSDWGRRIYEEGQQAGRKAGRKKGRAEGEARALLMFLETRGIRLTAKQLGRVESCRDTRRLEGWIRRAATATTATDVFGET